MRRPRRPNATMVVAFLALVVALGGTAFAATGQLVNIADGTNAAQLARVDSGKVRVGDGSGPVTVDGTVTTQSALPTQFFRVKAFASSSGCFTLGSPPAGKAWILRSASADANRFDGETIAVPSFVAFY